MPNEIIVKVKVIEDPANKAIRDKIRADARDLGETIAIDVNQHTTQRLEREAQAAASGSGGYSRAGDAIGDAIGRRASERITERIRVNVNENVHDTVRLRNSGSDNEHVTVTDRNRDSGNEHVTVTDRNRDEQTVHVHVSVDVDQRTLNQRLASVGKSVEEESSSWFKNGFSTGITGVFSGDFLSTILKGSLIGLGTTILAPALASTIGAAVLTALSGGAIGVGIVGALKDPRIKVALNYLKEQLKDTFSSFSANFKGPLEEFFAPSNGGGGGIAGLLKQINPMIQQLGEALGPISQNLGNGIIGMLQNLLPPIIRAAEAGAPLINTLARQLPGIGDALGSVFQEISSHSREANTFFNDLLHAVKYLIIAIGALIGGLIEFYSFARKVTVGIVEMFLEMAQDTLHAADMAFGWIPGMGPKLHKARTQFDDFVRRVERGLKEVPDDKYIDIHIRTIFNGVFNTISDITRNLKAMQYIGHAYGGVAGSIGTAATGGSRNGMTLVGEHGPELINAAPGSQIYSNADSLRMIGMGGAGRLAPIVVNLMMDGKTLARAMVDPQREYIRNYHGGSVQAALGT